MIPLPFFVVKNEGISMANEERKKILVVDDDRLSLVVAEEFLKDDYDVDCVDSGEAALLYLQSNYPDVILLDLHMPGMGGRETLNVIMSSSLLKHIPVICITADSKSETEIECLSIGALDYITKPFVPQVAKSRISRIVELNELKNNLAEQLDKKTRLLEKVTLNFIMAIANTIDAKDAYTSGHSIRVAKCAEAIATELGWDDEEVQNIKYIALLHDIGKIGIPDAILNKPYHLSVEEFNIVKKHPIIGREILKDIHMIDSVTDGALYHHERYDGNGYPFGLKGKEIPLCARIVGIADSYDAMTSNRVYRSKLKKEDVISEFERCKGTQFDPELTELFLKMLKRGFYVPEADYEDNHVLEEENGLKGEVNSLLSKVLSEYTEEAKRIAMKDALTGLYNRSYAETTLPGALKENNVSTLFMIDINNFSEINEMYGHIAGDFALTSFADNVKQCIKEDDILCRVGKDRFVLLVKGLHNKDEIRGLAQNILTKTTAGLRGNVFGNMVFVTIGIAIYPENGSTYELLYENADKASYHLKRNDKSAFEFFEDGKVEIANVTMTDINHIRSMIEGKDYNFNGVFHVEYDEFKRMYNYIARGVVRNHQSVQTVLFTLEINDTALYRKMIPDEAMNVLEAAVASSLRMVDVGTRYSSVQYIVILLDADFENGKKVAQRVMNKFYKMYARGDVDLSYDIQTMCPKTV